MEQYFLVLGFLRVAEEFDHSYAVCYTKEKREVVIKLFCIDPSRQLSQALKRGAAAVFFSATLSPMAYFRTIFGCGRKVKGVSLASPFPEKNFAVYRANHVSTYYRQREKTQADLCRLLSAFTESKSGNYIFFFPSYAYLKMIHALFVTIKSDVDIIVQTPGMSETERRDFLSRFQTENRRLFIGFAVLGGIFGEGIDLTGDRLCGAAVIGVGLPGITIERELIRNYYQEKERRGFEFAYQFPGINRVLQAAGRVIRTETDRGVVLLVDPRFARPQYCSLLPDHWHPVPIHTPDRLHTVLETFWGSE